MLIQTQGYNAIPENDKDNFNLGRIMTQYSLKIGMKELGARGGNAVKKELSHLHNMHTFIPHNPREITREMRQKAIASLMFLKEKINGDLKGRAYANDMKQSTYIKK